MKGEWETRPLADVCLTIQDGAHESPKVQFDAPGEGRFPYITSKNIRPNRLDIENVSYVDRAFHERIYPRCRPSVGDVLLTKDGANTGNVALNTLDEPFSLLSSVCLIKTDSTALIPSFLSYYIQSPDGLKSITGKMSGAAIRRIILRDIKRATIPLPPLAEQQRVVSILDGTFDGIAVAKANAEKNLQNARALFDSHLNSGFDRRDGGWVERRFEELATFRNGINYTRTSRGESIDIVGVKDFQNYFSAPLDRLDSVTVDGTLQDSDTLRDGDLLFVRSNGNIELIGRCLLVEGVHKRTTHSGFTIRARLVDDIVSPRYLCHFLKSKRARQEMVAGGSGTNIKSLNQSILSSLVLPIPPVAEQTRIVAQLEAFGVETRRLEAVHRRRLAALEELKKALLNEAFGGRLTKNVA